MVDIVNWPVLQLAIVTMAGQSTSSLWVLILAINFYTCLQWERRIAVYKIIWLFFVYRCDIHDHAYILAPIVVIARRSAAVRLIPMMTSSSWAVWQTTNLKRGNLLPTVCVIHRLPTYAIGKSTIAECLALRPFGPMCIFVLKFLIVVFTLRISRLGFNL